MISLLLAFSVVVSASSSGVRAEDESFARPTHVEVLGPAEVEASGASTFPELLSKAANVHVRTLNVNPLQSQISMGGFGENSFGRVKVVIDGEEINSVDQNPPDLHRISLGSVSRVEIVHGPSCVLDGDGAEAGVIRVSTDPLDYSCRTRLSASVGSYGAAALGVETRGGLLDAAFRYSAAYRFERADGYRDRSGFDLHEANASLVQDFENGSFIGLKTYYSYADYEMPGALSWKDWKHDPRHSVYKDDWCRVSNFGLSLNSKLVLPSEQYLSMTGSFAYKNRVSHWGNYHYQNDYDLWSYDFSPRYVNEHAIGDFDNRLTAGFVARFDDYRVHDRSGFGAPRSSFTRTRGGAFAQDEFSLSDEWSLVAGARFEGIGNCWEHVAGLRDHHSTDWAQDYELGLVYRPWQNAKFFLKGARYHRSAFCDELNYTEDGTFLNPERGTSLDFGFSAKGWETIRFDAFGYLSWLDDEIFYNPHAKDFGGGAWGGYNANSPSRTTRRGFDLALSWREEKFAEASIRYSFVDARFASGVYEDSRIPLVPQSRVRAQAGVWILNDLELKGGYQFIARQHLAGDFTNDADELPSTSLFDLGLYYDSSLVEGLKVSLVVDNLLDRSYCDFAGWSDYSGAYYYPAVGRTLRLSVSYEW